MTDRNAWIAVICSLLYPAFLGNVIYAGVDTYVRDPSWFLTLPAALFGALAIHFVMDFVYTLPKDPSAQER